MKSITIPDSVTSIGLSAFSNCEKLTSVTIPYGVDSIGGSAFDRCTGLNSVTIKNSLTSINGTAFNGCTQLNSSNITIYQNPDDTASTESITIKVKGSPDTIVTITLDKKIINALAEINKGNGTVQNYTDAQIKGVTEDNLASVNKAVAIAKGSALTMAEIKTAVTDGVASVEITRNSDTLTAELKKANGSKFTTSAQ